MTCARLCCSQPAQEDREFRLQMKLYGLPQRRYTCMAGHSTTTGVPEVEHGRTAGEELSRRMRRQTCRCGEVFETRYHAVWCSSACRLRYETAKKKRTGRTKANHRGPAVRFIAPRAVPRPYAEQPRNLNMDWV